MKNLRISLLATLMLIGFSTSVLATVDCTGLQKKNRVNGELTRANIGSEYYQCKMANRNGHTWTFVSSEREIRYQNQKWDGVRRYEGADNSSVNSVQAPAPKVEVVVKKSRGQSISELAGLYAVIVKYGMKDGLVKIRQYWLVVDFAPINLEKVEIYLTSISWTAIEQGAEKFAMDDTLIKFLKV